MKLMGYRFVVQTGVLTATCRRKLSRGALVVGYSIESETNYCEVKIRDGIVSVNSRSQSVSRTVRHVPEVQFEPLVQGLALARFL